MSAVVQGLPLRHNFYTAQNEAATPWSRLYFPEEASYHAVNSLLFKRLQETLETQDREIHAQKQQDIQTHNIAVTAEVPVEELKKSCSLWLHNPHHLLQLSLVKQQSSRCELRT